MARLGASATPKAIPGPGHIREEFWTQLIDRLTTVGFHPAHRDNHCYLRLGVASAKLVLTAPTREGGIECKLSLVDAAHAATPLTPQQIFDQLYSDRGAIEAQAGYGPLEWGSGKSGTRVYLGRPADIADRRTWQQTTAFLTSAAERFTGVFRPSPGRDHQLR